MLKLVASFSWMFLIAPSLAVASQCEPEAQLNGVMIQICDGERFLGTIDKDGSLAPRIPFDAIPLGIETFWSDRCQCDLWQVSGIAGAHTRVVLFFRPDDKGTLRPIPGGEFGSETGKISRVNQSSGFTVEVRDSDVSGKHKTLERYRFDGAKFLKLK